MSDNKTKSYLNIKSEKIPIENGSNDIRKEKIVNVPIMIDDDFDKFFSSSAQISKDAQIDDVNFDHLKSSRSDLYVYIFIINNFIVKMDFYNILYFSFRFFFRLVQRKKVKVQHRKHEGSKNPLKALATNHDLAQQQYTENKSNLLLQRSLETCK